MDRVGGSRLTLTPWHHRIEALCHRLAEECECTASVCAELECHVDGLEALADPDDFWRDVQAGCEQHGIALESIGAEEDAGQFEFRLKPSPPLKAATDAHQLKMLVPQWAQSHGLSIQFDAQPKGRKGNALQWHLHLNGLDGRYLFFKQEEKLSPPLAHSIGGLLATLPALLCCFAPTAASFARLNSNADHVPQTLSWGGNNRTVALRLPESVIPLRHIEHRVGGADANPFACVWALLVGVHYGLTHHTEAGEQQFGNATRSGGSAPPLPCSLQAAHDALASADWLADYHADMATILRIC